MSRLALEVAHIFRSYGSVRRQADAGRVSLDQLKVMSAIRARSGHTGHVGFGGSMKLTPKEAGIRLTIFLLRKDL